MSLEITRQFIKVVQMGSFTKAAEVLKVTKSSLSKSIAQLERDSGTQLLVRTTRSLSLTAAGRAFYESCLGPLQSLEDAEKSLYGKDAIVAGKIRITAPEDLGLFILAPLIGKLRQEHPSLNFDLHYTNRVVDLVTEGFDLAIRLGKLKESRLRAQRIGEVILVLVASPRYLKKRDKIRRPQDLKSHECVSLTGLSGWNLRNKKETQTVKIEPCVESNQMTSLLEVAKAGGGIALVPSYLARKDLEAGLVERVLPEWSSVGFPVSLVSPLPTSSSARLKLTAEAVRFVIHEGLRV